jgi:hypothetical protein
VCGRCWAAHGGSPGADEIGPEPLLTAPLRYPTGQRAWLTALIRAAWVQDIRVDGRQHLVAIARVLARHANWTTLESWPGWDTIAARTKLSRTTIGRWLLELRLRGWLVVVETGSTPATRPMALIELPDGTVLPGTKGNRTAVYALRTPLSPDEAFRWAADVIAEQAAQQAAQPPAGAAPAHAPETRSDQGKPDCVGDKKGSPTGFLLEEKEPLVGGYARVSGVVDDLGMPPADPWGEQDQRSALRAPLRGEQGSIWASTSPTSGFEMLIAADWLRRTVPVFARVTRKAVRAVCRPFWRAGWSNLDIVHAMDHLPAAFGPAAGTPIGRGPADGLDPASAWWWIRTRLDAWRTADDRVRTGFYQVKGRQAAMRRAVAAAHGRAAAKLLREEDLTVDTELVSQRLAQRIVEFGRRVAAELRPPTPRPAPPAEPTSSEQTRAAAAERRRRDAELAEQRQRAAAEHHQAVREQYREQMAAARAALAERTGGRGVSIAPPAPGEQLTREQIHERARQLAAGYRRNRRLGGPQ